MLNNSQSMVLNILGRCMGTHVASLGNFAQPVVMRIEQHYDSVLFSKPRVRLLSKELTNSWSMVSVSCNGNHAPPVVMEVNSLSKVSVTSMENHAQTIVMIVEQQLEHALCVLYRKS